MQLFPVMGAMLLARDVKDSSPRGMDLTRRWISGMALRA
jgi:hypothetical protein